MNILLISQCNKKALPETRRVLDHFAERKGDRTWQTAITQQGLVTLRKMLKKNARRNTAVACHRIGGKNSSELLWIVGNVGKFNEDGTVPTNTTQRNILRSDDENRWHTAEDIAILSTIAALFHDFGKANVLFQEKLKKCKSESEPYRHEWVSLRMFQAFVQLESVCDDRSWLERLAQVNQEQESSMLEKLTSIQDAPGKYSNPFANLPAVAKAVAWLILTHHKLPQQDREDENIINLKFLSSYLDRHISPKWNSPQIKHYQNADKDLQKRLRQVWEFEKGTPLRSFTWRAKAQSVANRALKRRNLFQSEWMTDLFSLHLSRLALMLADHYYSSKEPTHSYQDKKYKVYANTDRKLGTLKQRLDEHLVGVYRNAHKLVRVLPDLKKSLPSISRHKDFKKRAKDQRFRWQDKAFELASSIRTQADNSGFFGVNLASTGCGKTFANARIMYGLANEREGCRFNVALGLRTLTLQTGDAFQQLLHLDDDDLAVLIGSQAVRTLYEENQQLAPVFGSESSEELLESGQYVRYEGALSAGSPLHHWLEQSPHLNQLVSAPIVVSTIDHLMPATEGVRGGKQIAPMLRLLTADLVLDEPDEFGLQDIHALARLVHWAGLLGAKVLLSSATLSPNLIAGLFQSYQAGRQHYQKACGLVDISQGITCAWFDEKNSSSVLVEDAPSFLGVHQVFVAKRVDYLHKQSVLRKAKLLPVSCSSNEKDEVIADLANTLHENIVAMHFAHAVQHPEEQVSISVGLVRIANIQPLVNLAKELLAMPDPENVRIHYCIYHSQFPLLVRSDIERQLDEILNRKNDLAIWERPAIKSRLLQHSKIQHHIFVVLASPVAEVGRDHDYDWAIAEPSSMRSIIQLAGRIQRHRMKPCQQENLAILSQNVRACRHETVAFTRPGFEQKIRPMESHKLEDCMEVSQYAHILSSPCIKMRENLQPSKNLSDLEHNETALTFDNPDRNKACASQWLQEGATLTGELQRVTPFRLSRPSEEFYLSVEEGDNYPKVFKRHENGEWKRFSDIRIDVLPNEQVDRTWITQNFASLIEKRIADVDVDWDEECRRFGVFELPELNSNKQWVLVPELGFHSYEG